MVPTDGFVSQLDAIFRSWVVAPLESVIFFNVAFWDPEVKIPLVVLWLIVGATFFTLRFRFINFRGFCHAVDCVRGRYTRPEDANEMRT